MAPSSRKLSSSPSLSGSDISNASPSDYVDDPDFDEGRGRKRRRLSPDAEHPSPSGNEAIASATISRIRPLRSKAASPHPGELQKPAISNGKAVDGSLSFASLGAAPWLIASLANMAILRPTGIQKGCIPKILEGRDIIGGSKTGSGKTVAFTVPILQKWAEDPVGIFALVLTPTR